VVRGILPGVLITLVMATSVNIRAEEAQNRCLNPGFELLNPAGNNFPVGWNTPLGTMIDKGAHSGAIALHMAAAAGERAAVNGSPIAIRSGVVTFWYKALKSGSEATNLRMFVIGLDSVDQETARAAAPVPREHVGDGRWHQGKVDFDFGADLRTEKVFVAPRINEAPSDLGMDEGGEWLLDDFVCVETRIGPRAEIEAFQQPQPVMVTDQLNELILQVANTGDAAVPHSHLRLRLPAGVAVAGQTPPGFEVDPLQARQSHRFTWQLVCREVGEKQLGVEWNAADFKEGAIIHRTRKTVCVKPGYNARSICTGLDGYWRFTPAAQRLQAGNDAPLLPLATKKSVELPDSMIGVTAHMPRAEDFEKIFEPEYLIDGNPETSWSGKPHFSTVPGASDWVEVQFKKDYEIHEVRLVPYWKGMGFPVDFTVTLRAGGRWVAAYTGQRVHVPADWGEPGKKQPFVIKLYQPVKADGLRVEVTRVSPGGNFFCEFKPANYFRLSEIEALDTQGANVALASRGARVRVPATFRSWYNSAQVTRETYPELYNLGVKWNRIGQWGDWTALAIVEHEKGEYIIDPTTDQAVTDSVKNGVNILFTLAYGNPLYEKTPELEDPGPTWRHGHPFRGDGGPTTPEAIQGFVNYARFCAQHFKGRVDHWEIWNEENSWAWYGTPPDPKAFGTLVRETAKVLKEVDPENYVIVGGTAALAPNFIAQALELGGGGPYINAIGFHPYGMTQPELGLGALDVVEGRQQSFTPEQMGYKTYEEMLDFLRKKFAPYNARLDLWADEWNAIPNREDDLEFDMSELGEAKQAARFFTMATLTHVRGVWWSLANQNYQQDCSILRMEDLSRKPLYYTIQALSTLLAGAKPEPKIKATAVGDAPELVCRALRARDGELLVAVWSAVKPDDDYAGKRATLKIKGESAKDVDAVDTLHAVVQRIRAQEEGGALIVNGLLVMDYPVIVRVR
jgi:hypothetical protein